MDTRAGTGLSAAAATSPRPFVGRAAELRDLESGLADAVGGRGSLFMIGGEAGIGKTRLAEEIVIRGRDRGATAVWGACWERGGAPAYWPWIQAIRGLAEHAELPEVMDVLGPRGPLVAQIVPDLAEAVPGLPDAPPLDSEQARFALFDAVASFIRVLSGAAPAVIVLDDMHAADQASLHLLEFVSRSITGQPTQIVVTYRDAEARAREDTRDLFAGLERTGRRVRLGGLKRMELADLVAAEAGTASPDLTAQLHTVTDGNPFFVDEVIRMLRVEGFLDDSGHKGKVPLRLPAGVRETIRRRLAPLSGEVELLSLAAVIGRDFGVDLLREASGRSTEEVSAALDAAIEAGVLRSLPRSFGRFSFSHPLLRETLYEDLPASRRGELHRQIGEAIEARTAEWTAKPYHALAHHFLEASARGEPDTAERAVGYAELAGNLSMEQLAYEQAADLYADALGAAELATADDSRHCRLEIARGGAELLAGHIVESRATLLGAARLARAIGDAEQLAQAALTLASRGIALGVVDDELSDLLAEALELLPTEAGRLRARVSARLAASIYWSHTLEQREALVAEAIETARALDDPETLAWVLIDSHLATWVPENSERSLQWADEVVRLNERLGDPEISLHVHSWRVGLLLEMADVGGMGQAMAAYARAAETLHQPRSAAIVLLHGALRALIEGRLEECERRIGEAATVAPELADDAIVAMMIASMSYVVRLAQGRLEELEAVTAEFAENFPAMPGWRAGLTRIFLDERRDDELRREFERLAQDDFGQLPRDNIWISSLWLLTECCAYLGDAARAEVLLELLRPFSGRNAGTAVAAFGPVDRALGLLAATTSRLDEALEWFESGRQTAGRMGARVMLAQLLVDEAQVRLRRGQEGDADAAAELLETARREAVELELGGILRQLSEVGGGGREELAAVSDALRAQAAADGTVTIMFSDIEASTELNQRLGDRAWLDVLKRHNRLLREQVAAHGGAEVKSWGDGFMFAFPSVNRGLAAAIAVQRAFAGSDLAAGEEKVQLRIGLHSGEAIREEKDYFGHAVNLASRITGLARGGEILVSSVCRDLVRGGMFSLRPAGEHTFKGFAEPESVYVVEWDAGNGAPAAAS